LVDASKASFQIRDRSNRIIIVNDGSIDGSSAICQSYAKGDSRIIYIYQSNQGESSARNKALEIAKGEYVLFVDSDDYIDSSLIDEIIEIAKLQYYDVIRFGLNFIDENNQLIGVFKPEKTSTESCQALLWAISKPTRSDILRFGAYAVKSSVLRDNSIRFDEQCSYGQDQEFTHTVVACSATYYTLEKAYYYYYQHSESLMHTRSLKQLQYIAAIERASKIPKIQSCNTLKKNYEKNFCLIYRLRFNVCCSCKVLPIQKLENTREQTTYLNGRIISILFMIFMVSNFCCIAFSNKFFLGFEKGFYSAEEISTFALSKGFKAGIDVHLRHKPARRHRSENFR